LTPPKLRLSEDDVEAACKQLLALRGWWVGRNHCGTFKSADNRRWIKGHPKGTPDYACMHERHPGFLLEVKRPGEKPSPEQELKHRDLRIGFRLAICTIDSVEGMLAWLDQHERKAGKLWREFVQSNPAS
jgi:hypothetical protein